jgi:hypothetical protein
LRLPSTVWNKKLYNKRGLQFTTTRLYITIVSRGGLIDHNAARMRRILRWYEGLRGAFPSAISPYKLTGEIDYVTNHLSHKLVLADQENGPHSNIRHSMNRRYKIKEINQNHRIRIFINDLTFENVFIQ